MLRGKEYFRQRRQTVESEKELGNKPARGQWPTWGSICRQWPDCMGVHKECLRQLKHLIKEATWYDLLF